MKYWLDHKLAYQITDSGLAYMVLGGFVVAVGSIPFLNDDLNILLAMVFAMPSRPSPSP